MSASREKKGRYNGGTRGGSAEASGGKTTLFYSIVIIAVAVAAVFLLVWNSGIVQRHVTAATINGTKYTVADLQYYYNTTKNALANQFMGMTGTSPFDYRTSPKDQIYDVATGETWYDYILKEAANSMALDVAIADKATAEGYKLSEEGQESLDSMLASLDNNWAVQGYPSQSAFIHANFGAHMTYDHLVELLTRQALIQDYSSAYLETLEDGHYTDEQFQAYYNEHTNELDSFTISQAVFQASVPMETDTEGKPIELPEDQKTALLDEAKAEAKKNADEFKARLDKGEDFDTLVAEFGDKIYNSSLHQVRPGSSVNSAYRDWAYAAERKAGDITMAEFDASSSYLYYVAKFEKRQLDQSKSADVRHVLVAAEGEEPTQEQYDAAEAKAKELLDGWKAGEATEETFSAMATANSADTGSAANGGLIANVNSTSTYVPDFQNWCMDPARKPGDTALVKNTGSSIKGWHIMYYVKDGQPVWKQTALNALMSKDYSTWQEEMRKGYASELGLGAKFLQA